MKLILLTTLILFAFSTQVLSQVGVGTVNPTAALDINGDLRIRTIISETDLEIAKDSVLVISRDGTVKSITSEAIFNSVKKTVTKANFLGTTDLDINLLSGSPILLPFDGELIDLNEEYDTSSYSFTPKQDGYYRIFGTVNLAPDDLLGATSSLGVSLQVRNGATVISEASSALVGAIVGTTDIYLQPIRTVQTIAYLTTSDVIGFYLLNNDTAPLDIDLLTGDNAYIFIEKVK
ncbi:hypothetical protein ATE92_0757 [Ulvibacter sp. MAR_2010_11]|uniref:hypothetical protein n=1 Tax=Ulvibacter sp. MAR_2010_11 TaxID=1250229 RepID=UPI000C2C1933|nr:hypothetical protein [Ulvibacter sp. MAR_2010_11]PKA82623.1 hypothetical protein ATE92_0757 [Ulvibacter sp. MAR_2010_11]